jgi:hypothetical protein
MRRLGLCVWVAGLLMVVGPADASKVRPWHPPSAPGHPGVASWPYRMFDAGMEVFERQREHAPRAQLSFRLIAEPMARLEGLSLELHGRDEWTPVLDMKGTFTLERSREAAEADAWLISNRLFTELGTETIWVRVRTPGLPDNVYRMGDLRVQCQVFTVTSYVNSPKLRYEEAIRRAGEDHCKLSSGFPDRYVIAHDGPIRQAFVVQDGARTPIMVEPAWRRLYVPIHDDKWTDDALIEVVPETPP